MTITVYTSTSCMACKMTKDLLDREGIPYAVKNISENDTYRAEVEQLGFSRVPVTVGKTVVSGFDPEALKKFKEEEG